MEEAKSTESLSIAVIPPQPLLGEEVPTDPVEPVSENAQVLISAFEEHEKEAHGEKKIRVNRVVAEVATWYERIRNAMDYRADEVILRAAIERILKRRVLLLKKTGRSIAEPLLRELIWARYFPDGAIPEAILSRVARSIDLYLALRKKLLEEKAMKEGEIDDWIFDLMSSDLEHILNSNKEDIIRNYMFQVLRECVVIPDDTEETRDAQVFIAVCKSFAKDDVPFIRYHLFKQYFIDLNEDNIEEVAGSFTTYVKETKRELNYKLKDRIFSYVRNQTPPFFILRDLLFLYKGDMEKLAHDKEACKKAVFQACESRYKAIARKVQRAIIRSVIFILLTKTLFALSIEGTYETLFYGKILWSSMLINIGIPPILMIIVGLFIRTPSRDNSERIFERIDSILFDEKPKMGEPLTVRVSPEKTKPFLEFLFRFLWVIAFAVSFGLLYSVLSNLHFNIVNKGVFMFFFTIVSFLSYRIGQTAGEYSFQPRQGLMTPIVDFLFMPIIRVGRNLTEGIAQMNMLIFVLDFIIETPFKGAFAFFEQWFIFLHTKREELG